MNKIEERILEEYLNNYNAEALSYEVMGMMLDDKYVGKRLREFGIESMYIYGGTYMGIQLYRIAKIYSNVLGIVDKYGKLVGNDRIPVLLIDDLKKIYKGEKIVVTPIRFFKDICEELEVFVDKKSIIGIGELMFGLK